MEIKLTLTDEELTDIIITALEGGSNYWLGLDEKEMDGSIAILGKEGDGLSLGETIAKAILEKGFSLNVYDREDEDHVSLGVLSRESLQEGFAYLQEENSSALGNILSGSYDAADADCFFQCATMKKIVYA